MNPPETVPVSDPSLDPSFDRLVSEVSARLEAGEAVDLDGWARSTPNTSRAPQTVAHAAGDGGTRSLARVGGACCTAAWKPFSAPRRTSATSASAARSAAAGWAWSTRREQISLGRRVALKVLPFAAMLDPRQLAAVPERGPAAAALHHPNIVGIYSVGCERGVHYYAMQYIEGRTLAEVIDELRASSPLPRGRGVGGEGGRADGALVAGRRLRTCPDLTELPLLLRPRRPERRRRRVRETHRLSRGDEAVRSTHPADPQPRPPTRPDTARVPRPPSPPEARTSRPSSSARVARLGIQAAEALEHAHQMGVVHRDIKPSNLMVDARGHLWITDFGLAMTHDRTRP